MGPSEIGPLSEGLRIRDDRLAPTGGYEDHGSRRFWGIQRFVSSYIECLLPLFTFIHVIRLSLARRLPATRERPPRRGSASHKVGGKGFKVVSD